VGPLPGLSLEPVRFTPLASVQRQRECGGVRIAITDRRALRSVDAGVAIASAPARACTAAVPVDDLQPLLRHRPTLEAIRAGNRSRRSSRCGVRRARRAAPTIAPRYSLANTRSIVKVIAGGM
jgi:hypothetical protein